MKFTVILSETHTTEDGVELRSTIMVHNTYEEAFAAMGEYMVQSANDIYHLRLRDVEEMDDYIEDGDFQFNFDSATLITPNAICFARIVKTDSENDTLALEESDWAEFLPIEERTDQDGEEK